MIFGLPYDAEIEYLESTGTQWIDTGIYGNEKLSVEITLVPLDVTSDHNFMGVDSGSTFNNSYNITIYGTYFRFVRGNTYVDSYRSGLPYIHPEIGKKFNIKTSPSGLEVDGVTYSITDVNPYTTIHSLPLFAWWRNQSLLGSLRSIFKFYSMKMYEGDVVLRDFKPVRFTNENGQTEGGIYDKVGKRLFRNSGTGDFVLGPDKSVPLMGLWIKGKSGGEEQ